MWKYPLSVSVRKERLRSDSNGNMAIIFESEMEASTFLATLESAMQFVKEKDAKNV